MEIMVYIDYCIERIYIFLLSYFVRWFQVSEQQLLQILFSTKDNFDLVCECILMIGCFISLIGLTNAVIRKSHALGDSLIWASTCYVFYLAFTEMMEEFSKR